MVPVVKIPRWRNAEARGKDRLNKMANYGFQRPNIKPLSYKGLSTESIKSVQNHLKFLFNFIHMPVFGGDDNFSPIEHCLGGI